MAPFRPIRQCAVELRGGPVVHHVMSKTVQRTPSDRQHQAALRVSTKQIAQDAVRGGPKSVKKDKRPTGHGQKG